MHTPFLHLSVKWEPRHNRTSWKHKYVYVYPCWCVCPKENSKHTSTYYYKTIFRIFVWTRTLRTRHTFFRLCYAFIFARMQRNVYWSWLYTRSSRLMALRAACTMYVVYGGCAKPIIDWLVPVKNQNQKTDRKKNTQIHLETKIYLRYSKRKTIQNQCVVVAYWSWAKPPTVNIYTNNDRYLPYYPLTHSLTHLHKRTNAQNENRKKWTAATAAAAVNFICCFLNL